MTFQLFVNSFSYIFSRELWFPQIRLFSTMISWYFRKSTLPQRGSVDLKRYIHYCRLYLIELSKDTKFIYLFVIDVFLIEIMLMITLFSFLWVPNPFYHTLWSIPYLLCSHFSYRLVLVGLSKKEFLFSGLFVTFPYSVLGIFLSYRLPLFALVRINIAPHVFSIPFTKVLRGRLKLIR